jgi:hypothetical protein
MSAPAIAGDRYIAATARAPKWSAGSLLPLWLRAACFPTLSTQGQAPERQRGSKPCTMRYGASCRTRRWEHGAPCPMNARLIRNVDQRVADPVLLLRGFEVEGGGEFALDLLAEVVADEARYWVMHALVTLRDMLCCVHNRKHVHLVRLDVVDDAVGPFHDFSNLTLLELRDDASGKRKFADLLRSSRQAVNDPQSVLRGVSCDVGVNGFEVFEGGVGPVHFHFGSPNFARTCSTSVVRPAWLSAKPDSMA